LVSQTKDENLTKQDHKKAKQTNMSSRTPPKGVKFSVVQIREYALTLGPQENDFPMSLDWQHSSVRELDLSAHESNRVHRVNHMTTMQRQVRLSVTGGIPSAELEELERERRGTVERKPILGTDQKPDVFLWSDQKVDDVCFRFPKRKRENGVMNREALLECYT
jgi:hypothetical protein